MMAQAKKIHHALRKAQKGRRDQAVRQGGETVRDHPPPAETGPSGRSLLERSVLGVTLLSILVFFGIRLCLLVNRYFNIDEFQHLHYGWMLAHGYVPYRDFWDSHTPLLWVVLAPLAIVFDENPAYLFAGRILILLITIGVGLVLYRLARLVYSLYGALFSLLLLSLEYLTLEKGIEVRPDQVLILTWLLAAWFLTHSSAEETVRREMLAGLTLGLGLLFTPKALFAIASLGFGLTLLALPRSGGLPGRERRYMKGLTIFAFTASVPLGLAYLTLSLFGAGQPLLHQTFIESASFEQLSDLALRLFKTSFMATPVFWVCGAIGAVLLLRRVSRLHVGASLRALVLILVSIVGAGIAYFIVISAPYKQSMLPLLFFLAIAGGAIGDTLFQCLAAWQPPRLRLAASLAFCIVFFLGIVRALAGFSITLHPLTATNTEQLQRMTYVLSLSTRSDSILDGEAAYIFRPQASFYGVLVQELLSRFNTGALAYDIPARCADGGCKVAILDSRIRQMPQEVLQFINTHYSPTSVKDVYIRIPRPLSDSS